MPIDVHAHYVPRQLLDAIKVKEAGIGVRLQPSKGSDIPAIGFQYGFSTRALFPILIEPANDRCARLDRQGIDHQLVATWPDMYGYGLGSEACAAWHRMLNDTLSEWCVENSDRFSFVASVPLANDLDAAAELDRAGTLGAVAVMIPANVEGTNIGELPLEVFWGTAERLGIPVILHPVSTVPSPRTVKFSLTQVAQYTFDTTIGIGSMIFTGLLDRFPRLTLVLVHGGGAFPYLVGRFDVMYSRMDRAAQGVTALHAPSAYTPRMAYDTIVHAPKTLRFLAETVGLEQLVLGTDESFPPADIDPLSSLSAAEFSSTTIQLITEENPRRFFPQLK